MYILLLSPVFGCHTSCGLFNTFRALSGAGRSGTSPYKGRTTAQSPTLATAARSRRDKEEWQGRPGSAKRASPSARRPSPKAGDRLSDTEVEQIIVEFEISIFYMRMWISILYLSVETNISRSE